MAANIPDPLAAEWKDYQQNFEEQLNEILAIKSFYENTDDLEIIQEASIEQSKLSTLQFKINLECNVKPLNVEIWLPIEKINRESLKATAQQQKHKLERSISGHHATTNIKCESLPPLYLNVVLPASYPSHSPPLFTVSCFWLNKSQLSRLCSELDKIWKEYNGMAVIYTWIEWLQMNTLSHLEVIEEPNSAIVMPLGQYSDEDKDINEIRAVTTFNDIENCIYEFLRFNHLAEMKSFKNSSHTCPLCFDEKIGTECFRLNLCKHIFCADCLITYCEMLVRDGTIQLLKCPEANCKELIPEEVLQMVLTEEEYNRWERLLLQRTLDSMQDIIYCPRCSVAVVVEENDNHAYCMNCRSDFCKLCKEPFHVGKCDSAEEKLNKKAVQALNLTAEQLLALNDQQIRERFKNADFVIKLKEKTEKEATIIKTESKLSKYKMCPRCRAPVDKFEGCNKVTCICGQIFCYVCGRAISGYEHFSSSGAKCALWNNSVGADNIANRVAERELHQGQRAINRILDLVPNQQRNLINCPRCGQRCLKMDRNNHIKCWCCQTNFCFCCKNRIEGVITAHFKPGLCKQHSD